MNKLRIKIVMAFAALVTTAYVTAGLANRSIDSNYTLKFSTSAASGTFSGLKGLVSFYPEDVSKSKIEVTVDAASINTGSSLKDTHAKSEDWLNTDKYPLIKFTSTSFKKQNDQFIVSGNMELRGVTKPVEIPFSYKEENGKGIFSGTFSINRTDYGVTGSGLKAKIVGENVKVNFNIPTGKI
jgi:polyisoprenoid-binding protein YceI